VPKGAAGGGGGLSTLVGTAAMAGLAVVKVELEVEGMPAPPLPGDAPAWAGVPEQPDVGVEPEPVKALQLPGRERGDQDRGQV
jgi:hypothetical protein